MLGDSSLTLVLAIIFFLFDKKKYKQQKQKQNGTMLKWKSFCTVERNHHQNEKATYRMGEYICKSRIQ